MNYSSAESVVQTGWAIRCFLTRVMYIRESTIEYFMDEHENI